MFNIIMYVMNKYMYMCYESIIIVYLTLLHQVKEGKIVYVMLKEGNNYEL